MQSQADTSFYMNSIETLINHSEAERRTREAVNAANAEAAARAREQAIMTAARARSHHSSHYTHPPSRPF